MAQFELLFESGDESLSVRSFRVDEGLNELFTIAITARSVDPDLDLESFVGRGAAFAAASGVAHALVGRRAWSGVCRAMDLVRVESTGLSTYELTLAPRLWQLTQRRNHRLFQHISIPDMVDKLLGEWSIEPEWRIARGDYPKLELRVQYGESDYDFLGRLLEEAGITFLFADGEGGTRLVLDDQPHGGVPRPAALPFSDSPGQAQAARQEYVTAVRLHEEVRPARHIVRDYDYRRPTFRLEGSSAAGGASHALMEQYHYLPGAGLAEVGEAGGTPTADDKGMARHSEKVAQGLAARALQASRGPRRVVRFDTSAIDLAPGSIFSLANHPRGDLGPEQGLLVAHVELEGTEVEEWRMRGMAVFAKEPYHPPQATPKPRIHGMQSALVVGPDGQEIYTDEFGRVRVQFHWDREGDNNDDSSVWMRVVYNASGPGSGIVSIPRVGHEVIIAFMEGDPDLPLVVGSTYNATSPVPYELPDNKTVSTWKAASSPGGEGFNEIKMENKAGQELLYQQAEKDLAVLVKNDEVHLVGHDRSVMVEHDEVKSVKNDRTHVVQHDERTSILNDRVEQVGHDEHVGIGNDRVHQIKANNTLGVGKSHVVQVGKSAVLAVGENRSVHVGKDEQVSIGEDQSVSVGQSRSTSVGVNDAIQVGSRYTVTVSNGLKGKLASALGSVLDGGVLSSLSQIVGPFATGPLQQVVGKLAKSSMGATPLSKLIQGPAAALQELLPGPLQGVASMVSGQIDSLLGGLFGVSGGPPTTFDMVDKKITLTTGDASIVLDGGKIILQAKEGIFLTSSEIGVQAAVKIEIVAGIHPVALAAASAAGKAPPPEGATGALLLSGMKELAAISPLGNALFAAKEGLVVGCETTVEVMGKKGALLLSTEGDSVVKGKMVQLNPPAKAKEEEEHAATPNEGAEAPGAAAFENAKEYHFAENVHIGDAAMQEGAEATKPGETGAEQTDEGSDPRYHAGEVGDNLVAGSPGAAGGVRDMFSLARGMMHVFKGMGQFVVEHPKEATAVVALSVLFPEAALVLGGALSIGSGYKLGQGIDQLVNAHSEEERQAALTVLGEASTELGLNFGPGVIGALKKLTPALLSKVGGMLAFMKNGDVPGLVSSLTSLFKEPAVAQIPRGGFTFLGFGKPAPAPSGAISPELQALYMKNFNSNWFRGKLQTYSTLTRRGPVNFAEMEKMLAGAEFRNYRNIVEAESLGYAGKNPETGGMIFGLTRPLRDIPAVADSVAQHELFHLWQYTQSGFMRVVDSGGWQGVAATMWAEVEAVTVGGPLSTLVITVPAVGGATGAVNYIIQRSTK
jgi:type VI secretion system secreted protein VgrG